MALVYGGTMFLSAVFFNAVWWYGTHHDGLLDPDADPRVIRAITGSYQIGFVIYSTSLLIAYAVPVASLGIYGLLAVFYALPGPGKDA